MVSNLFAKGSKVCVLLRVESKNDVGLVGTVKTGISSAGAVSLLGSSAGSAVSGSESSGLYGSSGTETYCKDMHQIFSLIVVGWSVMLLIP